MTALSDAATRARSLREATGEPELIDFLTARLLLPWPGMTRIDIDRGRSAAALYDAYKATSPDPLLRPQEFGESLRRLGYRSQRDEQGISWVSFYDGQRTRQERAEAETVSAISTPIFKRMHEEALRDHRDRVHPLDEFGGREECGHRMPDEAYDPIMVACDAAVEEAREDGTFDATLDRLFGAFLRWLPGDPDPNGVLNLARARNALRTAQDVEADRLAGLASLRATLDSLPEDMGLIEPHPVTGFMQHSPRWNVMQEISAQEDALHLAEVRVARAVARVAAAEASLSVPYWPEGWSDPNAVPEAPSRVVAPIVEAGW